MSFLRRVFGGSREPREPNDGAGADSTDERPDEAPDDQAPEADEQARELDLLRGEQSRLDELRQRQLRYADRAWTPPTQGGERRADDGVEGGGGDSAA